MTIGNPKSRFTGYRVCGVGVHLQMQVPCVSITDVDGDGRSGRRGSRMGEPPGQTRSDWTPTPMQPHTPTQPHPPMQPHSPMQPHPLLQPNPPMQPHPSTQPHPPHGHTAPRSHTPLRNHTSPRNSTALRSHTPTQPHLSYAALYMIFFAMSIWKSWVTKRFDWFAASRF